MKTDIATVCSYCGVGCDITAVVEDNKIEKIYAQADGYVSRGKLCIKGKYGFDFVHSDKRIRNARVKKSFIEKNKSDFPDDITAKLPTLVDFDEQWYEVNYDFATSISAWKLKQIKEKYGRKSFCATGGARTSCESGYILQKFTRKTMQSPNIDNCARVCHSPSLSGMRQTIGEGAATNPFDDIYETQNIIVIGSNTTEAHPIVANRIVEAANKLKTCELSVIDIRNIHLGKFAKNQAVIPFESNLLTINMLAYVILNENLYNKEFIDERTVGFDDYKKSILEDEYANPDFYKNIEGYEYLADMIPDIARTYATKKSMLFWGLGITEHIDGSYAVMAMTHLALITGNIGKTGTGLMPLRGQNNVQGTCDVGCLPYYAPDYEQPEEVGLMTPDIIDEMLDNKIKCLYVMGEDITHIHPNQNKIHEAIENLEFIVVQDLFMNDIASKADMVFGVKSAYEKTGVYVNAMRRMHLSQPLVTNNLPDDWEVLRDIENKINNEFLYKDSEDVWNETRLAVPKRYSGASYKKLSKNRARGLQWPVFKNDTPILHLEDFRTKDGFGRFKYHQYKLRGHIKKLINKNKNKFYYLSTGRVLYHYNNAAQTMHTKRLWDRHSQDTLLVSIEDKENFTTDKVILKSEYGRTAPLEIKFTKTLKTGTLFTSFHHAKSKINFIFGDESDELVKTARFKSVKIEIEPA